MRQRQATCMQKLQDGSLQVLDSSQCPRNEKPDTEELCTQAHCGTLWYMTDWSKVSYQYKCTCIDKLTNQTRAEYDFSLCT